MVLKYSMIIDGNGKDMAFPLSALVKKVEWMVKNVVPTLINKFVL